ncbi:MAG: hypothetical protein JXX14_06265 [Deltaproteobacteria bacterium]|nr:hypothetical protein [Deltaproteobacteria bacterium]
MPECNLCGKEIESFHENTHQLSISDTQVAYICTQCIARFIHWQQRKLAALFPTKANQRRYRRQ